MASPEAILVNRLVSILRPGLGQDEHADKCALAMEILSCRVEPRIVLDVPHVQHEIHATLARRQVDPAEIDSVISRFLKVPVMQRPASALYLLCNLAFNTGSNYVRPAYQVVPILMAIESATKPAAETPFAKDQCLAADDDHERMLIRDSFFIIQGTDGDTLRFDGKACGNIKAPAEIPSEDINLVRAMSTIGVTFKKVTSYIGLCNPEMGRVQQALSSALQVQITLFYRLLAVLEQHHSEQHLALRRLYVWIQRPLKCMVALAAIVDVVRNRIGSSVLSLIESACRHGDPYIHDVYESLLRSSSQPLFDFVRRWISVGELQDPYNEFFIIENNGAAQAGFWTDQYSLRREQIPTFLGLALAERILSLGKSVQFIRLFGDQPHWMADDTIKEIAYGEQMQFEAVLDRAAALINEKVLQVVREQYRFMAHCTTIKNYILMAQGDYVENLLDLVFHELAQPAQTLYRHHLNSVLESAIRAANPTTYDHSDELQRLCVRLLEANPGDIGWDVFSLDYRLYERNGDMVSALGIMFPSTLMRSYLQVFNFMFRIKRIDRCLSDTWKRYNTDASRLSDLPQLNALFHKGHILRHEMVQLVHNLNGFMRYDVIEDCWVQFLKSVEAAPDFDGILAAHTIHVNTLLHRLFLGNHPLSLQTPLLNVCDCILRFCYIQTRLHDSALEEIALQKTSKVGAVQRVNSLQTQFHPQLDKICELYRENLAELVALFQGSDLRYLAFRLDFNDFYHSSASGEASYRFPDDAELIV